MQSFYVLCLLVACALAVPQQRPGVVGQAQVCAPCHECPCNHPDLGTIKAEEHCKHCFEEGHEHFCGSDGRIYLNKCFAKCYNAVHDNCHVHCDHENCRTAFPQHFGGGR